jgi:hypothetical protein
LASERRLRWTSRHENSSWFVRKERSQAEIRTNFSRILALSVGWIGFPFDPRVKYSHIVYLLFVCLSYYIISL